MLRSLLRQRHFAGAFLCLLFVCLPASAQIFFDATSRLADRSGSEGAAYGASTVDLNQDGRVDLVTATHVHLQQSDGTFADWKALSRLQDQFGVVRGLAWGDIDNDGYPDPFMVNTQTATHLWQNTRISRFETVDTGTSLRVGRQDPAMLWADFDRDGTLDVFYVDANGNLQLYQNRRDGGFKLFPQPPRQNSADYCGAAASDYNRDSLIDVYIVGCHDMVPDSSYNELLTNVGNLRLLSFNSRRAPASNRVGQAAVWLDFDNDGWQDLYVANTIARDGRSAANQMYRNLGGTINGENFEEVPDAAGASGLDDEGAWNAAAGDFDNDGWIDLVVTNRGRAPRLFRNNQDGTFTDIAPIAFAALGPTFDPTRAALSVADINADGWLDLYLVNEQRQWLLLNTGGTARGVAIRPVGQQASRLAIGTRVVAEGEGITRQVRDVSPSEGSTSHHQAMTVHLGLGSADVIPTLTVRWATGRTETYTNVALPPPGTPQVIDLVEGIGPNAAPTPFGLRAPALGTEIPEDAQTMTFEWEPATDPEADSLGYTLYVRGPGLEASFPMIAGAAITLPASTFAPGLGYVWNVEANDRYQVRQSADPRGTFRIGETVKRTAPQPLLFDYPLPQVSFGDLDLGDYDGDGDLDLIISGLYNGEPLTRLYAAEDSLFEIAGPPMSRHALKVYRQKITILNQVWQSDLAWGDYDGDGDLDLALSGLALEEVSTSQVDSILVTEVYRNQNGVFVQAADLMGVYNGSVDWGDYDGDGDLDLLVTGAATIGLPYDPTTIVYRNDGGTFTAAGMDLPGVAFGAAAWVDFDGDGDLDASIMGDTGRGRFQTMLLENQGGQLTERTSALPDLAFGDFVWHDYDGDGDQDVLLTGGQIGPGLLRGTARIFANNGSGQFTDTQHDLDGIVYGSAAWGDYDLDGDADLLLIGADAALGTPTALIYRNENGGFIKEFDFGGFSFGALSTGDYNGDGDLDFVALGTTSEGEGAVLFFMNRVIPEILPPE